jgi:hypothetical protein
MTHAPLPSPSSTARRLAARDREFRRLRILSLASAGRRYAAIGRQGAIARARLLAKLNALAEPIKRRRALYGDAPQGEAGQPTAETALDAADGPDFVDDPAAPSSAGLDIA